MQTSNDGIELIKRFEGCSLQSYRCPAGIWTIGYGHTGSEVKEGQTISQAQADSLLKADVEKFATQLSKLAETDRVQLRQCQFDALVCFAFNVGFGNLKKSTLWSLLREHATAMIAADQFARWNKAGGKVLPGLTKRRAAERELFLRD